MPSYLSIHSLAALLPLAIAAAGVPAGAQRAQPLLPCTPAQMAEAPCLSPYDVAPSVAAEPPLAQTGEERRTSQVWMLVDETGVVREAQIGRSAGNADWDFAAVSRAREYRFQPATHGGRPVAAWILVPVAAAPRPQSCADFDMGMPLSAGVAEFMDSVVFDRPEHGTSYRYRAMSGFPIHVFVYPAVGQGSAGAQVQETIAHLRSGDVPNGPDSLSVLGGGRERVRLSARGGGGVATGHAARLRLWFGGEPAESYVAVFPAQDGFVKFRATYPPGRDERAMVGEFVEQILSDRGWRERGCPR